MLTRRTVLKLAAATVIPTRGVRAAGKTTVTIDGAAFRLNGRPTYEGRSWRGFPVEGLLMNSRMVQGIFDDLNPDTRARWAYPDTGRWDPDRNTREFVEAMPEWRRRGLLSFTINFQGGSPEGYSQSQPWHNNAFAPDGTLRPDYLARLERILDRADDLGMAPIVGYFYFGQDQRLEGDEAVRRAVREATTWLLRKNYRNLLIEIANECDNRSYEQPLIKADRVHELVELAQSISHDGWRYPVSVSYNGGTVPHESVARVADFLLLHGNGVREPARIGQMVEATRKVAGSRKLPILFNEDDHFDFDKPANNFVAALEAGASWGYFDFRMKGEGFADGYQSVPVDWGITSDRKRAFFRLLEEITAGGSPAGK